MSRRVMIVLAMVVVVPLIGSTVAHAKTSELAESNEARIDNIENNTPGGVSGCSSGQIAKFNGVMWTCASDDDSTVPDTNAATICDAGLVLTGDGTCKAYPVPENVLFVAGDSDPFTNGANLLAALSDLAGMDPAPSENLPYLVKLGPGVFHLNFDAIFLPAHVTLAGSGKSLTRIISHPQSDPMVTMHDGTGLMHLSMVDTSCENFIGGDFEVIRVISDASGAAVVLQDVNVGADTGVYFPEPPGTPGILCRTIGLIFGNAIVSMVDSRLSAGDGVIIQSFHGTLNVDRSTIVADPRSHSGSLVAISAGTGGNVFFRFSSVTDDIYVNQGIGIAANVVFNYSQHNTGDRLGDAFYTCVYSFDRPVGVARVLLDENCDPIP